jgi:hypothetical protein
MAAIAAEKIIQFPRQLELPLVWWNDSELWRERVLKRAHAMLAEDEALDNVYWLTKALQTRSYVRNLSSLQCRIDDELQRFNNKTGYTESEKAKIVAKAVNRTMGEVLTEMEDIAYIMRYTAKTDHLIERATKLKAAWECLQEITLEDVMEDAA